MIQVENITFQYEDGPPVLDGVTLKIQPGEWLTVIGPNGSGKSTLARHLNGLLLPAQGRVLVEGLDTAQGEQLYQVREKVAFVFQNPDNQLVATSVEEDIVFGPENLGLPAAEIDRRLEKSLAITGMAEKRKKAPHLLSGGEKQRVAIAGALAMQPQYLVLDEPTSMLDPQLRLSVVDTLRQLHQDLGMGIIYITNIMEEALLAERVLVLVDGKIAKEGSPQEIFADHQWLRNHQLDMPPVCRIAGQLADAGYPQVAGSLSLSELAERLMALQPNRAGHLEISGLPEQGATGSEHIGSGNSRPGIDLAVPAETGEYNNPSSSSPEAGGVTKQSVTSDIVSGEEQSAPPGPQVLIRLKDVDYTYQPGSVHAAAALQQFTLDIQRGELVALIGHSGSGKSTLAQLMTGLMLPQAGIIRVKDQHWQDLPKGAIFRDVGLVFQYPEQQIFGETVFEEVAFGPRNFGIGEEDLPRLVEQALTDVGLEPEAFQTRSPFALSGGQKRRVCIASILAMGTETLILDEPTAGLDEGGRQWIINLVQRLHKKGKTIIWISHNMEEVAELAERIVVLSQGRLLAAGCPTTVFAQEQTLAELGLDIPVAAKLVRELQRAGADLPARAVTVADALAEIQAWLGGGHYDA